MTARPEPGAILAAPNRSRIRAVVQQAAKSPDSPRKWQLRLYLESVEPLYGGTFVHEGETVDCIAFDLPEDPTAGVRLASEAEYVGGSRGGMLRLHDVRLGAG